MWTEHPKVIFSLSLADCSFDQGFWEASGFFFFLSSFFFEMVVMCREAFVAEEETIEEGEWEKER